MQFFYPQYLNALWLVAVLVLFFIWTGYQKWKLLGQFGTYETVRMLIRSHSYAKARTKKLLLSGALVFAILALAQPQWGEEKKEIRRKGVEIIFLVDTSLSMLAEDMRPSRIEKAKLEMRAFLKQLRGDRIGIVTFAGSGFVQSPLTLDYNAFNLFANSIQVGFIPDAGTSLSEAIRTATKGFSETKQKHHVVIVLSDGEHHEGDVTAAIETAKDTHVRIYTIGIGTAEGGPIPLRSEQGNVTGYKKDRKGEVVITKLGKEILARIAQETGGRHFPATPGEREVEWIYRDMQNIEKKEFKQQTIVERENHFQSFLAVSILMLILEMLISESRKRELEHASV